MRHRPTPPPPRPGALRRLHTRLARLPLGRGRQLLVPLLAMGVLTVGGTAAASITGLPSAVIGGVPGGTGTPAEVTALADASAGAVAGRAERSTRAAPSATPSESVVPAAPAPVATSGPTSATTGEVTPPEARSTVTDTVTATDTATDTATAAAAAEDGGATEDDSTDGATDEGTAPAAEVTAAGSAAAGPETETETPAAGPETPAAGPGSPATGSPQPATTSPRPAPAATATPGPEGEVLTLVNRARAAAGCPALRADPGLAGVARAHSADMRDRQYFAHVDPDGRDPFDRARAAGLTNARAENIASGQPDAEAVMASWMKSPPHRENILDCSLTTLGVGVAQGAGGPWWTQLFGG